jgi:hypothetical protein
MITISGNQTTNVAFTLYEKTTLSGATYILDLYSNQNHNHTLIWLTGDTTNNNMRYNYFPIDLTPYTGNTLIGGTYDYFVWQTTGSTLSTTGLTISDIVESGLCEIVLPNPYTGTTYNNPKQEFTFE